MVNPVPVQQSVLCETCGMTEDTGNHSVYPPTHPFKPVAPSQSVEEVRYRLLDDLFNMAPPDVTWEYLEQRVDALIEAVRNESK